MYKLLYTLQIVEAVMEEGEGEGLEKIEATDTNLSTGQKKPPPQAPPLPGANVPLPPGAAPSVPEPPKELIVVETSETNEQEQSSQ